MNFVFSSQDAIMKETNCWNSWPLSNQSDCKGVIMAERKSTHERFKEKYLVNEETGCWEWQASLTSGYGQFYYNEKQGTAHRYSYEHFNGPIPDGLHVMHKCNNSVCCNPDHLKLGTHSDNMKHRTECGRDRWSGFRLNRPSNKTKWKTTMQSRIKSSVVVNSETGCWEWQKATDKHGYGLVTWKCKQWFAHRFAYMAFSGVDPKHQLVRHKCDNRKCCNPEHLELGTPKDNTEDAIKRGRFPRGETSGHAKLTEQSIVAIRELKRRHPGRSGIGLFLSRWMGVNDRCISAVVNGKSWSHIV